MRTLLVTLLLALPGLAALAEEEPLPAHPHVVFETSEGAILVELDGRRAPLTVKHFVRLVDDGHFDGTIFHRVIPDFVIQGGGYTRDLELREPPATVPNESGNGLTNLRGTIAMARQEEPHSARAQFYINAGDNKGLNPNPTRWGYAVFGYVIEGMDVVDRIAAVPTGPAGDFARDVPIAAVVIEKAYRQ
ncbi:MAG: peptidylprolyl isomerase [Woeseiaceae bacterium]|nr:peptidylprolyl isomerase [Woeseiaceae bacterium]